MELPEASELESMDIVCEVLGLNELQSEVLSVLQRRELTVKEIAANVGRSRSTVQRALGELLEKEAIEREGRTEKTVYYVYRARPQEELKQLASKLLEEWHSQAQQKL